MKIPVLLAALAASSLSAGTARAETLVFGLNRAQVADTAICAGEGGFGIVFYELYADGQPREKALPVAHTVVAGVMAPAAAEQRLNAVYEAKPKSASQWSRSLFVTCLADKRVPLERELAGRCYQRVFYLAARVPMAKGSGVAREQYLASLETPGMDMAARQSLARHVQMLWDRDPANADANNRQDMRLFLSCAAPGKKPVTRDGAAPANATPPPKQD